MTRTVTYMDCLENVFNAKKSEVVGNICIQAGKVTELCMSEVGMVWSRGAIVGLLMKDQGNSWALKWWSTWVAEVSHHQTGKSRRVLDPLLGGGGTVTTIIVTAKGSKAVRK